MKNVINHPQYYCSGKIEVIDVIEDWNMGFHIGNTIKYCARAGKKSKEHEIEDLKKALWYLLRYKEHKKEDECAFNLTNSRISIEEVLNDWNLNPLLSKMIIDLSKNNIENAINNLNEYIDLRTHQLNSR